MNFSLMLKSHETGRPDFGVRDGRLVLSLGEDATRDRLFTSLSTQLGEWYLNNRDGVPYYGDSGILGGKLSEAEVAAILRRRILLDPAVDRIESMEIAESALRHLVVQATVLLKSGQLLALEV